jgi:hypothetical protein
VKIKACALAVGDILKDSRKEVQMIMEAVGTHQMMRKTGAKRFFVVSFMGDPVLHILEEFSVLHIESRRV